jgi:lipoate-protein ligase A
LEGKAVRKVPRGKLVKAQVWVKGGRIEKVKVTGDFFLHPEEAILDIEESLVGAGVEEGANALERRIKKALLGREAELIGIEAEDIALVVREALP